MFGARPRLVAVAGLALFAGSCASQGDDAVTLSASVDSTRGYPVVRSTGTPVRWRTELIASVGADTGGPHEFGVIQSIVLDSRGSLFVFDGANRQLSAFDSLGRSRGPIGRRGRGPGEYGSAFSVAMLHDTVVLLDYQKIVFFSPEGAWVRDRVVNAPSGPQGLILYREHPSAFWTRSSFRAGGPFRDAFIRHTVDGAVDTIENREPVVAHFPPINCDAGRGGFSWYSTPFGPQPLSWPLRGGEQAVLVNTSYTIAVVGRAGDTVRLIERDVRPGPIGDAEWEREVAKFRHWRATRGNPSCTRNSFDRPPARPIVDWIFTDDEGHLWVQSHSPEGPVYEVFGSDGVPVARLTGLPPSGGVDPSVVAGRIALYAPDSNDIPRVQVFRIRK